MKTWWCDCLTPMVQDRSKKPRDVGMTMVIDKGLGLAQTADFLAIAGAWVDFVKLAFGSSMVYPQSVLADKLSLIRSAGVHVYPGGTLTEFAVAQGAALSFVDRLVDWGFDAVEISEGTVDLPRVDRRRLIQYARNKGLVVLTEVGKKSPSAPLDPHGAAVQISDDLAAGAHVAIIEGRDSGSGVGPYDGSGRPKRATVAALMERLAAKGRVMWEAPLPAQHVYWVQELGPNVNLGNVQPQDVVSLESLRQSLRSDTMELGASPLGNP